MKILQILGASTVGIWGVNMWFEDPHYFPGYCLGLVIGFLFSKLIAIGDSK